MGRGVAGDLDRPPQSFHPAPDRFQLVSVGAETDKTPVSERAAIVLPPDVLSQHVETYELQPPMQIDVKVQDGLLIAVAAGNPPVQLVAEAADKFFIREIGAEVTFNRDATGALVGPTFVQGGSRMEGKKVQ